MERKYQWETPKEENNNLFGFEKQTRNSQNNIIDKSEKYTDIYEVVIECQDEKHQEKIFNQLTEGGFKCRVLTF